MKLGASSAVHFFNTIGEIPSSLEDFLVARFGRVSRTCLISKMMSGILWGTEVTVGMGYLIETSRVVFKVNCSVES